MGNLAICANAVTTRPQAALRVAISVIFWSFVMPLIGFFIFAVLTFFVPLLFVLAGPATFFATLYMAGFVPSMATALFFQAIVHRAKPLVVVLATGLVSMLSATLWWLAMMHDTPTKFVDPSDHAYRALMAGAFGAALVMALSGLRARSRRQSLAGRA